MIRSRSIGRHTAPSQWNGEDDDDDDDDNDDDGDDDDDCSPETQAAK